MIDTVKYNNAMSNISKNLIVIGFNFATTGPPLFASLPDIASLNPSMQFYNDPSVRCTRQQ